MQTTMLCTTTEDATDFQWFKVLNKPSLNIPEPILTVVLTILIY